ncbi:bifunctional [glutamate--ammonia ligase]-adenylyl-L-tyrosine phosphorylase/[glutamate--ammonia-ligase] adenylyltransferase [Orrella sp. 11846]|uniref:bifunctional [glutamate--ammonia ligase]-adenylyl-L-tyrosine phosphorylase/[glutamate--ammonia-ligase] adenylyltransferase n=1 Tax=Orrella sp. 11846 TaxID=3409913 RepID=UPI003B5A96B8
MLKNNLPLDYLQASQQWSAVLSRRIAQNPNFEQWLLNHCQTPVNNARIEQWFKALGGNTQPGDYLDNAACRQTLRTLRQQVFFALMVRDIGGLATFEEVTGAMSALADLCVAQAYRTAAHQVSIRHGIPRHLKTGLPQEMILVAMGKLGGRELNVSSDIDLIMLYDSDGETDGDKPISFQEYYSKVTRLMMPILSELDANGQVFRTDLRLRPDGQSGALVWSLSAFEKYLKTQGREWERYAWIKARVIRTKAWADSAPKLSLQRLESLRRPFVYRKYFDFDALESLRSLREQIRTDWQRQVNARAGLDSHHNIKLGDGGIREIEFVVQLNQLIRGGNMPGLQQTGLLDALAAQVRAGVMPERVATHLEQAYRFLRRLEHFLQYREDEQTHLLPDEPQRLAQLAQTLGLTPELFQKTLKAHRKRVEVIFRNAFRLAGVPDASTLNDETEITTSQADALPQTTPITQAPDPAQHLPSQTNNLSQDALLAQFTHDQQDIRQTLDDFLNSHRMQRLNALSRSRIQALVPRILQAALETDDPRTTCIRLLNLIEAVAQRSAYLALLTEYPLTIARAAMLIGASPWALQYILRHPIVLNRLIDWETLVLPPDFVQIDQNLHADLQACVLPDGKPDVESQMNLMRDIQHQITFQLLAQDLAGILTVERLADYLSELADLILKHALHCTWTLVRERMPQAPEEPQFAIIAYGKLGSKELGYASDLDLVFLYEDAHEQAPIFYARLVSRLTSWLSTLTSSGRLYAVDLRLRPEGDAGLLVASVDSFADYQRHHAWVWEHQALTRARFVAGHEGIGAQFERIRQDILIIQRNPDELMQKIIEMRHKLTAGHPNLSDQFDLKHDDGGMVDLEFITQYLVLRDAHAHPELIANLGNNALLKICAQLGLTRAELTHQAIEAYRILRKHQHALRLQGQERAPQDQQTLAQARQAIQTLWESVFIQNA